MHWQEVDKSLELEEHDEASILVDVPIIVKHVIHKVCNLNMEN